VKFALGRVAQGIALEHFGFVMEAMQFAAGKGVVSSHEKVMIRAA
jgi:hypothetical protein